MFAASAVAGAFDAAPDNPYEVLQGRRGSMCFGNTEAHPAVNSPSARQMAVPSEGEGASAFPPRTPPWRRAARKEFRGYHQPLNYTSACVRCPWATSLAAPMLALRSLNAREHLGHFRAALKSARHNAALSPTCGTKSLPCGLRARGRPARKKRVQADRVSRPFDRFR